MIRKLLPAQGRCNVPAMECIFKLPPQRSRGGFHLATYSEPYRGPLTWPMYKFSPHDFTSLQLRPRQYIMQQCFAWRHEGRHIILQPPAVRPEACSPHPVTAGDGWHSIRCGVQLRTTMNLFSWEAFLLLSYFSKLSWYTAEPQLQ